MQEKKENYDKKCLPAYIYMYIYVRIEGMPILVLYKYIENQDWYLTNIEMYRHVTSKQRFLTIVCR